MATPLDQRIKKAQSQPDEPGWQPPADNVTALMSMRLTKRGHAPYVTFYDDGTGERTELSYATFENWVSKTANLLAEELEVERGDRVATVLGNHWTTMVVTFACWKVGAAAVPVEADGPSLDAHAVLAASGARTAFLREDLIGDLESLRKHSDVEQVVVVGQGLGARLLTDQLDEFENALGYAEEVLAFGDEYDDPDVEADDDALIVYSPSGGEHGAGVRLTQRNLFAAADALVGWGLTEDDRLLMAQPLQVADSLGLLMLGVFSAGASMVLNRAFEVSRFLPRVSQEHVTVGALSPRNLDALVEVADAADASERLRALLCPTGVAPGVARRTEEATGVVLHYGQGLVEASCASTLTPAGLENDTRAWLEDTAGRPVGTPTRRAAVTTLDDDGNPVAHGVRGLIAVRGPVVMAGYQGRPDLDERVFAEEWLSTGEVGFIDVGPDGRLHVFVTGWA